MYSSILTLHSLVRWVALLSLIYLTINSYIGWLGGRIYTKRDNLVRSITSTIFHVQLIIGLWLYFISPVVSYFLANFHTAVHDRQIRFFGMEHSTMMFTAIVLITIGSAISRRKKTDKAKFKTMAIWATIVLVFLLVNIPWPFSPFGSRPWIRGF